MELVQLQSLLEQMTIEEKLGQLSQSTGEHFIGKVDEEMVETGPDMTNSGLEEADFYRMGSVLGVSSAKITNQIQKNFIAKNRLHIPLLFMHDAIHGYKTIFPIPLALACSFDTKLVKEVAAYTATELRASGIHADFSPMTDLVRDARWGRVMESFGEDHILSGDMGKAMIQGYQKEKEGRIPSNGVAACLKHFAGYGAAEGGKDYASVDMSMREFFGFFAKPYEIALEGKPRMVMSSFNSFNGEPVTASKHLLEDILRKQFGFEDLIISDWGAVSELKNHGIAADDKGAAEEAIKAGVDIEMVSTTYLEYGKELIENSPELLEKINKAVFKVLCLKNDLGLFENPYVDEALEEEELLAEKTLMYANTAAKESFVLLKNKNILPFSKSTQSVLILGAYAKTKELLGNWQCKGKFDDVISIEEGMKQILPNARVYAYETVEECPKEVLESCEVILATIGESWELSGEGHSSANIELSKEQQAFVKKIKVLNKKTAYIACSGRPLALESVIDDMDALLWCWYPGTRAGIAIAETILGYSCPSGKLAMSFPRVTGQAPIRYNEYRSGRPANESTYSSRYQDCEIGPLFPFGHGLSYADIEYDNFTISNSSISEGEVITITVDVTNHSDFGCKETILLFMEDPISKMVRPVREMIGYKRISLQKQEKTTVTFAVHANDLKYLSASLEKTIEPGTIHLYMNHMEHSIFQIQYK